MLAIFLRPKKLLMRMEQRSIHLLSIKDIKLITMVLSLYIADLLLKEPTSIHFLMERLGTSVTHMEDM